MRVLCAPDSFKETISGPKVAQAMARGLRRGCAAIDVDPCPIADGGEGSLEVMLAALAGRRLERDVMDPLGRTIRAAFGIVSDPSVGIIELAQASGLHLLRQDERDPMQTSTNGSGQQMHAAIEQGCEELLLFIGGSATVDGGVGIAQALGVAFFDRDGKRMQRPLCGGQLIQLARIEPVDCAVPIRIACDVTNPLLGPHGAARTYGPQKGATSQQVEELERGLAHLANLLDADPTVPGSGAAGGVGFGLTAMLGATMQRGVEVILDAVNFSKRCEQANLVLTGEGCLDAQSLHGKACIEVARAAATFNAPVIAIVGTTGEGFERCLGTPGNGLIQRVISLSEQFGADRARAEPAALIATVAEELAREFS